MVKIVMTHEERAQRRKQIAEYLAAGHTYAETSEKFELCKHRCYAAAKEHGVRVKRAPYRRRRRVVDKARTTAMMDCFLKGQTLREIGEAYGITKEGVRLILKNDERFKGRHTERGFLTKEQLADFLGVKIGCVSSLICKLSIGKGSTKIRESDLPIITAKCQRACRQCGRKYRYRGNKKTCSSKCRDRWNEAHPINAPSRYEAKSRWWKKWSGVLDGVEPGPVFISFKEAIIVTGMSAMQVAWLSKRGILDSVDTGKLHPCKKTNVRLYSYLQCEAISMHNQAQKTG